MTCPSYNGAMSPPGLFQTYFPLSPGNIVPDPRRMNETHHHGQSGNRAIIVITRTPFVVSVAPLRPGFSPSNKITNPRFPTNPNSYVPNLNAHSPGSKNKTRILPTASCHETHFNRHPSRGTLFCRIRRQRLLRQSVRRRQWQANLNQLLRRWHWQSARSIQ